jgi:hypothetical protein
MKQASPTHGHCTIWKDNLKELMLLNYLQIEQQEFRQALEEALKAHVTAAETVAA